MATRDKFNINGVIDTKENVLENLQTLSISSGCFVTYDVNAGKWSVVINQAGTAVQQFDDSNIVGALNVSTTPLNELYNKCVVEFPHKDLNDAVDTIEISIPSAERYANERDNTLQIKLDTINDPVQAQVIGSMELKQSRVDRIVTFQTDFSAIGLKAGDIIEITNSQYGFNLTKFRVTKIEEEDVDDGALYLNITALEYSADVYNTSNLVYEYRTKRTGIIQKVNNTELQKQDDIDTSVNLTRLLVPFALSKLFNMLFETDEANGRVKAQIEPIDEDKETMLASIKKPSLTVTAPTSICEEQTATINVSHNCSSCLFEIPNNLEYEYTITGISADDINIPLTGTIPLNGTSGQLQITAVNDSDAAETMTVDIEGITKQITIYPKTGYTYSVNASPSTITEGSSTTVNITTSGIADGTVIPYQISGSASSKVTSPSLTGNVTISGGSASVTIQTSDDSTFGSSQSLTFELDPGVADFCGTIGGNTSITVNNNATTGPQPPSPSDCGKITIPVFDCPTYDGATGEVTGITATFSIEVCSPQGGASGVTVPTAISVNQGNPSTITVTQTAQVSNTVSVGQSFDVITSFNSIAPYGEVTGSTVTLKGSQV